MSSTHAPNSKKSWVTRASIGGASAFAIAIAGFGLTANAAGTSFTLYDEGDSPNPYSVTEGLVFYKAADMGWVVNVPISSITSLGYTVADGSSFAPSFQLVTYADRPGKNSPFTPVTHAYTRLVWEPYMQSPAQSANSGTYTNLQDGAWWTNQIISGPGSQSQPMPLNFFKTGGAAGWTNVSVTAIDVHQGSTSDTTSVVTHVTYNGTEVALGNADVTPFNQAAIDAATAPLNAQISSLNGQISNLNAANASSALVKHPYGSARQCFRRGQHGTRPAHHRAGSVRHDGGTAPHHAGPSCRRTGSGRRRSGRD